MRRALCPGQPSEARMPRGSDVEVKHVEGLTPTYRLARGCLRLYLGGLCRIRLENADLPSGAFVVSMNHRSALDMFLYVAILRRRLKFLAKRELLAYPVLGPILRRWCVPVNRGGYDRRALAGCVEALKSGFVLSVFPEGTRHAALTAGHGGAVLMAAKAGVPVVPGAILGRYRPFAEVVVRFGEPMRFPPELTREQRLLATEKLMETIRRLGAEPRAERPRRHPFARGHQRPRRHRNGRSYPRDPTDTHRRAG